MSSSGQCTPWQEDSNPEVGALIPCQNRISIGRYLLEHEPLLVNLRPKTGPEFWERGQCYNAPPPPPRPRPSFLSAHLHFHTFIVREIQEGWKAFQGGAAPPRGCAVFLPRGPTSLSHPGKAGPRMGAHTLSGTVGKCLWYLGTGHRCEEGGSGQPSAIRAPEEESQAHGTWPGTCEQAHGPSTPRAPGALVSWAMGRPSGWPWSLTQLQGTGASLDLTGLRVGRGFHTHFSRLCL